MGDENDMPMSGDGSMNGAEDDMERASANGEEKQREAADVGSDEKPKREKPLKIHGTLNDVLRVAMKPKVEK